MKKLNVYANLKGLMLKQKLKQNKLSNILSKFTALPVIILLLAFMASIMIAPVASADQFDEQINALNNDTSVKRGQSAQLGSEAASLNDKINKLQADINALQNQINDYQGKIDDLQNQITQKQQELDYQRKVLGENIRAMYLEGDISTLEILASSKDLSDFVDKQQYRNSVQSKIRDTMDKITDLKHQLKAQKELNEGLLKDKKSAQDQLNSQQAENNGLLALTEGQRSQLDQQIKNNNAQVAALRAQQRAANARFIGGAGNGPACGGGYPAQWCEIPMDSVIDAWGMYNRECVSYTAYKVWASGRYMPYWGGIGNANQWDDNARAWGIPVDTSPRAGDVAISNAGFYGHAMYVESVNGNGTINISQYNAALTGTYSTNTINPAGLVFIHF